MPEAVPESRTQLLDRRLITGLTSPDGTAQYEAFDELPRALSPREVSDIGLQVFLHDEQSIEKHAVGKCDGIYARRTGARNER